MSNEDIIRAWKDEEYRNSLSEEHRAQLPENPAGLIELTDAEIETINGGSKRSKDSTICDLVKKTKDPTTECKPSSHVLTCSSDSTSLDMFSI
ncbi:MAG: mersacidin/lichenicidin family type 2 lantibiotic [Chlorogloeopsis fritschii C42_A2020_084]|uniref:mersacidin/lichenicidin family type 2 lantibiotic n=1 Tax=Chlorogloeopsis fritschii TaxID=1124 RepID=UPI0019D87CA5|nr:mersacidin/lichenicidin family type 2 lantibiotic [Chlorogloeopsis fritschii]MBF2004360.1 mersacidin/lichenicidin family type 2 lantibiotic [Chlorogloeopsis fritschii C42_A2020_084]